MNVYNKLYNFTAVIIKRGYGFTVFEYVINVKQQ